MLGLRGLGDRVVDKVLSDLPGGLLIEHGVHQGDPGGAPPRLRLGGADLGRAIFKYCIKMPGSWHGHAVLLNKFLAKNVGLSLNQPIIGQDDGLATNQRLQQC